MQALINQLKARNELRIISTPLDIDLEIPHTAYIEAKKPQGGQALLFTNPVSAKHSKQFDMPVLMNLFGSQARLEHIIQEPINTCCARLETLLSLQKPQNLKDAWHWLKNIGMLRHLAPKITKPTQAHTYKMGDQVNLYDLPILTTWEKDGGPFITLAQIYTQSLDGSKKNLGMYRLQVYDRNHLGLHWQIHKDANHFFHEYRQARVKMPVSIAIGGDALYTWCAQAPLPYGLFELLLYGLIRKQRPQLIQSRTNPIAIPKDCGIIIEGWVDVEELRLEGPFGDHTGFYTPKEPYPVLEVSAIATKPDAVYLASVVGKPPLEDKYLGYFTERLFLPLLKKSAHGLLDYHMPENGVFHNLILAKIKPSYPGHASQIMHHFWGTGQMSFAKHAIFVGPNAPSLEDYPKITDHILNHLNLQSVIITEGICDALDHASPAYAFGGKLGIDATKPSENTPSILKDSVLLAKIQLHMPEAQILKQYGTHTKNPLAVVGVQKRRAILPIAKACSFLSPFVSVLVFVDASKNDLNNPYMLLWRVVNNIDAKRDVCVHEGLLLIDGTDKNALDNHPKEWPQETDCSLSVLEKLCDQKLIPPLDDPLYKHYHIFNSPST
ncbi:menaquinone biosynthesis decarboxylase [Helicobacter bizzozeronii]|uniref:menaquinone biosynthesis decarboxylase n=1 Tax=Helicobacter bizzozeronii TaxID=56877 RepID=UPI000CF15155|nr:menaquinone biosynthesis decarboxylase [Helicobacter bizzozeronii]